MTRKRTQISLVIAGLLVLAVAVVSVVAWRTSRFNGALGLNGARPAATHAAAASPPPRTASRVGSAPASGNPGRTNVSPSQPGQPASTVPSGILNTQSGPFPTTAFTVRDAWRGQVSSTWLWVYAGGTPTSQNGKSVTQPGLRLYSQKSDGGEPYMTFVGAFVASDADSPLSIKGVDGTLVTLTTDSGKMFHFDLQTKHFV